MAEWKERNPRFGQLIEDDHTFITIVDSMMGADTSQTDELLALAKTALQKISVVSVTDEILSKEVDKAAWLIGDEVTYMQHVMTSRRIPLEG
ncbi:hypothetical protein H0V99_02105 [Candidatus Saccharibacteria bacterium]|nr:hypothetical protein [Candidatus Saccharibacteria bacterium]